ncbi:hypothetical protein GN956_G14835 [Arapaima gigas]
MKADVLTSCDCHRNIPAQKLTNDRQPEFTASPVENYSEATDCSNGSLRVYLTILTVRIKAERRSLIHSAGGPLRTAFSQHMSETGTSATADGTPVGRSLHLACLPFVSF